MKSITDMLAVNFISSDVSSQHAAFKSFTTSIRGECDLFGRWSELTQSCLTSKKDNKWTNQTFPRAATIQTLKPNVCNRTGPILRVIVCPALLLIWSCEPWTHCLSTAFTIDTPSTVIEPLLSSRSHFCRPIRMFEGSSLLICILLENWYDGPWSTCSELCYRVQLTGTILAWRKRRHGTSAHKTYQNWLWQFQPWPMIPFAAVQFKSIFGPGRERILNVRH